MCSERLPITYCLFGYRRCSVPWLWWCQTMCSFLKSNCTRSDTWTRSHSLSRSWPPTGSARSSCLRKVTTIMVRNLQLLDTKTLLVPFGLYYIVWFFRYARREISVESCGCTKITVPWWKWGCDSIALHQGCQLAQVPWAWCAFVHGKYVLNSLGMPKNILF